MEGHIFCGENNHDLTHIRYKLLPSAEPDAHVRAICLGNVNERRDETTGANDAQKRSKNPHSS